MGRIGGAEALVRWLHPQRGMISPGILSSVRKSGRICQLDFYVFEQTCRIFARKAGVREKGFSGVGESFRRHFKDQMR